MNPSLPDQLKIAAFDDPMKVAAPTHNTLPPTSDCATPNSNSNEVWSLDDPNGKVRKPYTITKSRESWTQLDHDKFLEAIHLFDRDWKKIEAFVGTKTVIQIRSHAQKYFLKVQKSGANEHVPPPRPKRKAAHPYPHKASKNACVLPEAAGVNESSSALAEPSFVVNHDPLLLPSSETIIPSLSYWIEPSVDMSQLDNGEVGAIEPTMTENCCSISSSGSTQRMQATCEVDEEKGILNKPIRVMPDFSKVYSFIGSVFDPGTSGHLEKLKCMDPVDIKTILLLMENLSINLTSPAFEDHRKIISSYEVESEKTSSSLSCCSELHSSRPPTVIPSV